MIKLDRDIQDISKVIIKARRDLHQIPELGFKEYKTNAYIINFLKNNFILKPISFSFESLFPLNEN